MIVTKFKVLQIDIFGIRRLLYGFTVYFHVLAAILFLSSQPHVCVHVFLGLTAHLVAGLGHFFLSGLTTHMLVGQPVGV